MKRCVILMPGWRIAVPNKRELTARSGGVVRRVIICGLAGVFLALALNATAQTAPPKSIKDLVAQLEAARPQPLRIAELKAILAEPAPAETSGARAQVTFLRRQAHAAEELGQTGRELELRRRLAEIARGTSEAPRMVMDLAVKERLYGDYTSSMRLIDEVIRIAPNPAWLIGAYGRISNDRAGVGDMAGAEAAMRQADHAYSTSMLTLTRGVPFYRHLWLGQLECFRAGYLMRRGKLVEADVAFRKSVDAAIEDTKIGASRFAQFGNDAPGPEVGHASRDNCELGWAANLMQQRRHIEAEVMMRDQVQRVIARVGRDSPQVASALGGLGAVYSRQGRNADAEALLAEAVRIYERVGAEDGSGLVGRTRGEYAQALFVRGAYAEAVAQVERWTGEPARNPGAGGSYVISLVLAGKAVEALPAADGFLQRVEARFGGSHLFTGQAKGAKAMVLKATGKKSEALVLFRDSVRLIADARKRTLDDAAEALGKRIFGVILEDYLSLLAEMQGSDYAALFPRVPAAEEGLVISDLLRAGSVQRALAASAARASTDLALADTVRREQDLGEEAASLTRTLPGLLAAPPERQLTRVIAEMRTRIDVIRSSQTKLATEIEQRFPAYANLIAPRAPALIETQAALLDGEALLSIFVGETRSFVWAVPKNGAPVFHAANTPKREIEALTARVQRTVDPFSHGLPDVPPFALDEAHELYRLIVAPVVRGIDGARQVIVTTNGALRSESVV